MSLTDKSVVDGIARYLTKLNLLSLYGLVKITDASVQALADSENKNYIETLDINGCKEVSLGDEKTLKTLFPKL